MKKEYSIGIGRYLVDGFDAQTNTCYEYNGYFWHGHRTKITFCELYQNTLDKEKLIKLEKEEK